MNEESEPVAAESGSPREVLSFCRQCMGMCGTIVTLDAKDRVAAVRGDPEDPSTLGYACFKGLKANEAHNAPNRFLRPMKRMPSGKLEPIDLEVALDEIAAKLGQIVEEDGAEAVAGYRGGGAFFTSSSVMMIPSFLEALGSPKAYSSVTIDQSAKTVAFGRLGFWSPGRVPFSRADVYMLVGANPLVSVSANGFDTRNPTKRLRAARARGMKLVVIDPRRSETAQFADLHLQPLPGEDCVVLAGILNVIIEEGWLDRDFCDRYAEGLEELTAAVAPFTPEAVARRADVPAEQIREAARLFTIGSGPGAAAGATGSDMAPGGNLAEHLIECINILGGGYLREGDAVEHPGAIQARRSIRAEVFPPSREWEHGFRSRIGGFGQLGGELPTGTLPDEILQPGPGRVRALLVHGGNPASAIPDIQKVERAFEALDLLVAIEPFPTATTALADYVLPPTLQYERADLPCWLYESLVSPEPYSRFTPAVAKPPDGAELRDDHVYFWSLAKRMGLELELLGQPIGMEKVPTTEDVLRITMKDAAVSFDALAAETRGAFLHGEPQIVEAGDPESPERLRLLPADVAGELGDWQKRLATPATSEGGFAYRMAVRRLRDANNSAGLSLPSIKARLPYNPAFMNPLDMQAEGIAEGDPVEVASAHGAIRARASADPSLRRNVVSMTHAFGCLPKAGGHYDEVGVSTNWLTSTTDEARETINAMPWMTGFPISVRKVDRL